MTDTTNLNHVAAFIYGRRNGLYDLEPASGTWEPGAEEHYDLGVEAGKRDRLVLDLLEQWHGHRFALNVLAKAVDLDPEVVLDSLNDLTARGRVIKVKGAEGLADQWVLVLL